MRRPSEMRRSAEFTGSKAALYYSQMRNVYGTGEEGKVAPDPLGRGLPDPDELPACMDDLALSPAADPGALDGDVGDCAHAGATFPAGLTERCRSDAQGLLHIHDPPLPCAVCRGLVHLGKIKRLLDQYDGSVPPDAGHRSLNQQENEHYGNSQTEVLT